MCNVGLRAARYVLPYSPYSPSAQRGILFCEAKIMEPKPNTRPRGRPIKVWVTDDERAEIVRLAASANLSQSAYLRVAGMNHRVRSILDIEAVNELAKVNGDLGRVAGLLKLWLAEKRGVGADPKHVERTMDDFRRLQTQVHQVMGRVVR
jgi:hypothetical protein